MILVLAIVGLEGVRHGNSDKPSSESKVRDFEIPCVESGTANHGEAGAEWCARVGEREQEPEARKSRTLSHRHVA